MYKYFVSLQYVVISRVSLFLIIQSNILKKKYQNINIHESGAGSADFCTEPQALLVMVAGSINKPSKLTNLLGYDDKRLNIK